MKRHFILTSLLLIYSAISFAQNNNKNYILALSVDLYMNTSSRISCDNFATAFDKLLAVNVVSQNDSIAVFSIFINNVKYAKNDRAIDVRCKFIYQKDNTGVITVCTDGRNILLNGRMIKKNKKFIDFLNSIVHKYPRSS
jgi:hypothetical protein